MIQIRNEHAGKKNASIQIPVLSAPKVYKLINMLPDPDNPGMNIVSSMTAPRLAYEYALPEGTVVGFQYVDRTIKKPTPDGKFVEVDMTDEYWFIRGILAVPQDKPGLAFVLDNSPENGSNPNRPQAKPAKFIEVNEVRDAHAAFENEARVIRALALVTEMSDREIRELAPKFGLDPGQDATVLKMRMMGKVKTDPSLVESINVSFKPKVSNIIRAAEECKAISFYAREKCWLWEGSEPYEERILLDCKNIKREPKPALEEWVNNNAEIIIPKMVQKIKEKVPDFRE